MRKQVIDQIGKCYSTAAVTLDGETALLFAGEGAGSLALYRGADFGEKQVLWDESAGLGGTMSICPVEDRPGDFFVSTGFFTMVDSGESAVYLMRYRDGAYQRELVCRIPYLHRFDVLNVDGRRYLIAATLHSGKADKDDWSHPGALLTAELPWDLDGPVEVVPAVWKEGLTKNHGFNRAIHRGKEGVLIAAENGVFAVLPPQTPGGEWTLEQLFDFPASDVCALDLDGDGVQEYGILHPFHGDRFSVYRGTGTQARLLYEHPKPLDFYHAICAGVFQGQPSFVIGARKLDMDLYRVYMEHGEVAVQMLESGAGSSNARIVSAPGGDLILSANRQRDEAAVYYETTEEGS